MAVYKNSNSLMQLHGVPIYMNDVVDACLLGRLNLFLQGDTGSGKTQLASDAMSYFPDKNLFILGRNDMDTRELFQQINLDKLRSGHSSKELKELTDKINTNLIVVDELPNCVPAVRAQLFNLFDGYIEINGVKYSIGNGYSTGIATGNIGQQFTESSNELGRALKDRMHVIVDVDYFHPKSSDTLEILANSTNPRVEFASENLDKSANIIEQYNRLNSKEIPFEKLLIANYLVHGLDYCDKGSKRKMKDAWPNQLENHELGGDAGLVLPVSMRGAKSIIKLSQSLDEITEQKNVSEKIIQNNYFDSMMQAYKLVSAYSGVLNDSAVQANYSGDKYSAMDAVISITRNQFENQRENLGYAFEMINSGKTNKRVLDLFKGRWYFMKDVIENLAKKNKASN